MTAGTRPPCAGVFDGVFRSLLENVVRLADVDGFLTLDELVRSAGSAFVDDEPVLAAPPPSR